MSIFLEQFLMKRRREERGWLNVLFPTFIITRRMGWTVRHVCTLQWQRNWGRCHPLCGNTPGLSLQLTFPAFFLPPLQWAVLPSPVRYQEIHWASGRPTASSHCPHCAGLAMPAWRLSTAQRRRRRNTMRRRLWWLRHRCPARDWKCLISILPGIKS